MKDVNSNDNKDRDDNEKKGGIHMNVGIFAGLVGGGILGFIIGTIFNDVPLYSGFGMILGMAIAFDLSIPSKKNDTDEEETRE